MAKTASPPPALFPILDQDVPPHRIGPLARAAADAPLEATGCLTEYRPLAARSILSKTASKRGLPFTHAINPYRGCEFACRYCYARYTHEFLEMNNPEDFERKIYFKQNARWLLTQELKRLKPDTHVALGTATDPYQPLERKQGVTRSVLEAFAGTSGFQLGIVTKSTLILRDLDLLNEISKRHKLTLHITVTTMNTKLARVLEPRAPRPDLRIEAVATLRQAGLRTGVMCSPLMPGITDTRSSITAVAKAASQARANFICGSAVSEALLAAYVHELCAGALPRAACRVRAALWHKRIRLAGIPEAHRGSRRCRSPRVQAGDALCGGRELSKSCGAAHFKRVASALAALRISQFTG